MATVHRLPTRTETVTLEAAVAAFLDTFSRPEQAGTRRTYAAVLVQLRARRCRGRIRWRCSTTRPSRIESINDLASGSTRAGADHSIGVSSAEGQLGEVVSPWRGDGAARSRPRA
ncbi:MAG: hypothetical protein ACRDRU_08635 [Pseudonocardiaceae bacterium]